MAAVLGFGAWLTTVGLPAVVVVSLVGRVRSLAMVALLQDSSPLLFSLTWPALVLALVTRHWSVAAIASVVVVYHARLLAGLVRARRAPAWVATAPTLTVAAANVYVDNAGVDECARQLLATGADVLVVTETTPQFRQAFDAQGGAALYPHRTFDPDDASDYAPSLYLARRPTSLTLERIGTLPAAVVRLRAGTTEVCIVGTIAMASVERRGYRLWRQQMRDLAAFAARARGPLAGDLNSTVHRPAFTELRRRAGLEPAHDLLGLGLRPSFKLAAQGLLARLGPLVRLDHALLNRDAWATRAVDLDAAGSDHRPFVVDVALRQRKAAPRLAHPAAASCIPNTARSRSATSASSAGASNSH